MKDEFDSPEDRWFADRFARLDSIPAPGPPGPAARPGDGRAWRRGGAVLVAAAACMLLVGVVVAASPWDRDRGDVEIGPSDEVASSTTKAPSTTSSASSSTSLVPEPTGLLVVSEYQTECCYIEGSIGVLEVRGSNGSRVGELVESGPLVQVANDEGGIGFVSPFPDTTLPAGQYQVSVWQIDWPGTLDDADRMSQLDLCVTEVEVAADEVVELVATWTPGSGCVSFEPPTPTTVPPTTVSCGAADLSRLMSVFPADSEFLGEEELAALRTVQTQDSDFVNGYEWSVVKRVPGEVVLIGSVEQYVEGEPYLAYIRVADVPEWGTCALTADAEGFEPTSFTRLRAGDGTNNVRLLAYACPPVDRIVPVVLETPDLVAVLVLVERGELPEEVDDCGNIDAYAEDEIVLALPPGTRTLIDASTPEGSTVP